jgi:CRISPR/Cas system type I-B associated protein Csh2 (Cas7 group RAMP superfamily)
MKSSNEDINSIIKSYIKGNKNLNEGLTSKHLMQIWKTEMSSTITAYASIVNFRHGKLYVKVESAPLKQELFTLREKIKSLLNSKLSDNLVKEIIIL